MTHGNYLFILLLLIFEPVCANGKLASIDNYRQYTDSFSSSGQPSAAQLGYIKGAGFQRVIYLAYTSNTSAIETEDKVVSDLGMSYIQLAVDFKNPTLENFQTFAAIMQAQPELKTLLHCQINLRASTFSFLYRVIHLGTPIAAAKEDLDTVWIPDRNWFKFLSETLTHYGLSHECDQCDWGEREFD